MKRALLVAVGALVLAPASAVAITNTELPKVSGEAKVGATLTTSTGKWSPEATAFGYSWERCNTSGAECVYEGEGEGFNSKTYLLRELDAGHTVRSQVAGVCGGFCWGFAKSAPTAVVEPAKRTTECFGHEAACGFPDPTVKCKETCVGIEEGVTLTESGSIVVKESNTHIENKDVHGEIFIQNGVKGTVIKNDRVAVKGLAKNQGKHESQDIKIGSCCSEHTVTGTVLEHLELTQEHPGEGAVGEAIRNLAGETTVGRYLYVHGVDSMWFRSGTVENSWASIELGFEGPPEADHLEDIDFQEEGKAVFRHNVLLNPKEETAAIFTSCTGTTNIGEVTIEGNLLAGGGRLWYGGTSHESEGCTVKGPFKVIGNRYARCLSGTCPDTHGIWKEGGFFGPYTAVKESVTTKEGNVWDNNNELVP